MAAQLPWEKYGKRGPDDENNSLQVIINWWTTPRQYARYHGKGKKGLKKLAICGFLSQKMSEVSRSIRIPNVVKCRIGYIAYRWKKLHDWVNANGQGAKENDGTESFEEGCLHYCKHYFTLFDIMVERRSATPMVSSDALYYPDHLDSDSSDSSEHSSGIYFEETRPCKQRKNNKKKKVSISPSKDTFQLLDKDTLGILDGGNEIEQRTLEEVKRHNLVIEK